MKRSLSVLFFLFAFAGGLHAEDAALMRTGFFANAKEVFRPLLADPHEVQMALRLLVPVGKTSQGEVTFGQYFGLYRWALPWDNSFVQWSIGGAAFPRFDLATDRKDFEVVDYLACMPVDIKVGSWSTRLLPYHISSHLGDDYILRTGRLPPKYTFDSYKQLIAYDISGWRLYGGYNFVIRNEFLDQGHWATQSGVEWRSKWWARGHAQTFFADDFQSWERVRWNPTNNAQFGVKIANSPEDRQALSIFTEFGAGHRSEGQFFEEEETHWTLGLRFDL